MPNLEASRIFDSREPDAGTGVGTAIPIMGSTPQPVPTTTPPAGTPIPPPATKPAPLPGAPQPVTKPAPLPGTPAPVTKPAPLPGGPSVPGAPGAGAPSIPGQPATVTPTYVPPTGATPPAAGGGGGGGKVQIMDYRQGMAENDKDAITREVTDNELTSKQLERLLDENGRYIQTARLGAREQAAASGMLMSSVAAGAAQRAAIEAGAPIAGADANVYANTASENMRAQNEDAMADQGQGRQLFGQTMGLRAQLDDAEVNRGWQSGEAAAERSWRSGEASLDRQQQFGMQQNEFSWRSGEAGLDRNFNMSMEEMRQQFQRQEGETERDWRDRVQALDQQFTRQENALGREQGRFDTYVNMQANREAQLSSIISSIMSNPNLKPEQQQAAVNNARAMFTSLTSSFNAAFAQGVPPIFANPYPMGSAPSGGSAPPLGIPDPGAQPLPAGTQAPTSGSGRNGSGRARSGPASPTLPGMLEYVQQSGGGGG